jgi:hypothetical protein
MAYESTVTGRAATMKDVDYAACAIFAGKMTGGNTGLPYGQVKNGLQIRVVIDASL